MTALVAVAVLCVFTFAGISSQCTEPALIKLHPAGSFNASLGEMFNFTCSTNQMIQWEINDNSHHSKFPNGFTTCGSVMKYTQIEAYNDTNVEIRCTFRIIDNDVNVNIFSNMAIITPPGSDEQRRRRDINFFMCEADNVTFANDMEVSRIYIGSASTGDNCKLRISISRCEDSGNGGKVLEVLATEINIMATFNSVEMFYGYNVRVMIDNDCDFCGSQVLYLPDMKPTEYKVVPSNFTGTIIDDLSNDYCDFTNFVIHYRLCINSGGTNECFENPCGDSKIYPSLCRSLKTNGPVTLEASGIENGTIVSIYCLGFDCEGTFSEVMVFNLQIFTEDPKGVYNSDCNCKAPPQPVALSFLMLCNVTVDGRPGVLSWMDGERENGPGVVYPGEEKAVVKLSPPGNTVCSGVTDTRCTFNVTTEDYYTVSLTLTNDAGSSEPVSLSFNTTVFQLIEDNLRGIQPSVRVTVNEYCSNTNVTVSFGERENGSNNNCDLQESQSATLAPDVPMPFYVNETIVMLSDGYEYCFNISSFQEPPSSPPHGPTSETEGGLSGGAVAGIVIVVTAGLVSVVIVVVLIVGFIAYRKKQKRSVNWVKGRIEGTS